MALFTQTIFCLAFFGVYLMPEPVAAFQPLPLVISDKRTHRRLAEIAWGVRDDRVKASSTKESSSASLADTKSLSTTDDSDDELSMPWSVNQKSALRDNLSKYTVRIPLKADGDRQESQVYALWRTMLKELPELAGYPLDLLQKMHERQVRNNETLLEVTPRILPYLDDYEFASAGGVSGKIYGVPGLADGTRIETSEVSNIEVTLPQGFVRTKDGSAAYELGRPKREDFTDSSSKVMSKGGELLKKVQNKGAIVETITVEDGDGMLMRLGASTAILLAGATAVNMLSHHLTVNVFWV